ncbi:MAG: septum formation initiator family protein [Bacteroidetes bacterium]|nr:septum formation initiator family protein [Bacteroidota bacterium]
MKIWKKILPYVKNKFILTIFIFIIWILFFDRNNLIDRAKELRHLKQLEKDRKYYIERIDKDTKRLEQLKTNNKNLEKFAREQYLMKKDNEDIFVIVEED